MGKSFFSDLGETSLVSLKSLSNRVNSAIQSFNFDDVESFLDTAQAKLNEQVSKLSKYLKETKNSFEILIPYDRNGDETLSTNLNGNVFTAKITKTGNNGDVSTRELSFTVPDDVDTNSFTTKYCQEQKRMIVSFKKK